MTDRPTPNAARLPEVVEAARPMPVALVPQDDTKGCPPAGPFPGLRAAVICSSVHRQHPPGGRSAHPGAVPALRRCGNAPDTAAYDLLALGSGYAKACLTPARKASGKASTGSVSSSSARWGPGRLPPMPAAVWKARTPC